MFNCAAESFRADQIRRLARCVALFEPTMKDDQLAPKSDAGDERAPQGAGHSTAQILDFFALS